MGLFIKKPFAALQAEAYESGNKTLKRVLGPWSLIALGVGVIIGAGLFSYHRNSGRRIHRSCHYFIFCHSGNRLLFCPVYCYAEFASMIPVAGSAYTYSYATMGELIAWIIGWDLVLEYTVAATTVSISWSRYLVVFFGRSGDQYTPCICCLSLGRRYCEYTGRTDCSADEYFSDSWNRRKFYF